MNKTELLQYLPKNKQDTSNIELLSNIGFPVLNSILSELLFWVTDYNWPVAKEICLILKKAGEEIIPEIENILQEKDDERIFFLINNILPELDINVQFKLIKSLKEYEHNTLDPDYKNYAIKYLTKIQNNSKRNL